MRRVHVPIVRPGTLPLDAAQSHHLRDVLRIEPGEAVEVFDNSGRKATAAVVGTHPVVELKVDQIATAAADFHLTIAAAVPKGDRADWMIEKLCELGVGTFIPLRTARSVVHPEGKGKTDRWDRIAVEAAKQSHRDGVLTINPLTDVRTLLPTIEQGTGYFCSTIAGANPLHSSFIIQHSSFLIIGPEGGWTADEEAAFVNAGLTPVTLGRTILRIETAAVLAAGLAMLKATPNN